MTKPTLLALAGLDGENMVALEERFNVVKLYNKSNPEAKLNEVKDDVRGIIATMRNTVRENLISACPNLEIITLISVGYDNVDLECAKARNIIVTNTPDVVTNDTADTAMGLLLNTSRRYVEGDAFVRTGQWMSGKKKPVGRTLHGKKVGIYGLGRIGKVIARRCAAFDMHISYYGRHNQPDVDYTYYDDLIQMAFDVDYLILSCPGGERTHHSVNKDVFAALGPDGYVINVARGSVVDEVALVEALHNKVIAGAGLDVFENEPNVPEELKTLDNVALLPHMGAATHETFDIMDGIVLENLLLHFDGKPVSTPVTY